MKKPRKKTSRLTLVQQHYLENMSEEERDLLNELGEGRIGQEALSPIELLGVQYLIYFKFAVFDVHYDYTCSWRITLLGRLGIKFLKKEKKTSVSTRVDTLSSEKGMWE